MSANRIHSHDTLENLRLARINELLHDSFEFIDSQHPPRPYQKRIMHDTISDMKDGIHSGRWDIAVGGGKTFMALSLMKHIVDRGGKVLFITPDNTSLNNALESHIDKYMLGTSNLIQFYDESDIRGISDPKQSTFYGTTPYHYTTAQMLTYDNRFKYIPPDYYDLIVYEEPQGLMGDVLSLPQKHFLGMGIYMSATPYNNSKHLGNSVPHVYGEISSEYLIKHHNFPKWKVKNYYVDEGEDENYIESDENVDLDFEQEKYNNLLNINERFLIIESIFEEIIISGNRKGLVFMPSVRDAEFFVKYIVPHNPILQGKVDFVSGSRPKKENKDVENKLRSGELKVVLSKDIWNQALDIDDITDIILNDPTRSLQRLIQRIGRGARPSPGKQELRIHDLLSSFFHSENIGVPAVKAEHVIPQQQKKGKTSSGLKYTQDVSPDFIAALHKRRVNKLVGVTAHELEFRDEVRNAYFLSDKKLATETFLHFALQVFHVHPQHLVNNIKLFSGYKQYLEVNFMDKNILLFFGEFIEILKFYGILGFILEQDYTTNESLHPIILAIQQKYTDKIEERLTQNEAMTGKLSMYTGEPNPQDTSNLSALINERGGTIVWEEKLYQAHKGTSPYFSYDVLITMGETTIHFIIGKWSSSKKNAKHFICKDILDRFFSDTKNITTPSKSKNYISLLNEFVQKKGGHISYGNLIGDDSRGFKYSYLIVVLGSQENKIKSNIFSSSKKGAKQDISKIAIEELDSKEVKQTKTLQTTKKSSISLLYELISLHGGNIEFIFQKDENKDGYNFGVLIGKIGNQQIMEKTEDSFSESIAKEEISKKVYQQIKSFFPPLEEFMGYHSSHLEQLTSIEKRIKQGRDFIPEDILLMRKLKPGSTSYDYRGALWFLERKGVIGKITIGGSYRATLVQINGNTIGAAKKADRSKDAKFYRERACKTALENLLKIPEIKIYFLNKLKKQINKAKSIV